MSNKSLMRSTQQLHFSSADLSQAFDATLVALSTAVDLRNGEGKGHTQRLTKMAMNLAQALGMADRKLEYIRRGAVLHDIGNLCVPESILHKQGQLTAEEWVSVHMHPFYAFEMLESIAYLRPALEIPVHHHEKWDGTGYPRGLKGEEIPLAARIFAVIDVYDALTSDRPFRQAWSMAQTLVYFGEQSGKHFDPHVVRIFLENAALQQAQDVQAS